MAQLFLHVGRRKVVEFLFLKLGHMIYETLFVDEREKLWLNFIGCLAFGRNGRNVISIIIGEHHIISVDIEALGNGNVFLLFFNDFLLFFSDFPQLMGTELIVR
jgi:hypothetical protein